MKFRISLILLLMVLAASSGATAGSRECTDSTVKGSYAFTIHGQILTPGGPLLVDGIAKTTFGGNGELTQVSAVAINGNIPSIWSPSSGTYTVNSDCTGTMTLISTGQPPLHLAILVSQSGNHIHTVITDRGFAATSDAERIWAREDLD
jgi:microcystin-dependent protein